MKRLLGKDFPQFDRRTLRLSQYVDLGKLPPLPDADDNYQKLSRMTMAMNNEKSCCVVSGAVHAVQVWSSMAAREQIISDVDLLKVYNRLSPSDNGLNELAFLNWWTKNPLSGHPLGMFVAVNPQNQAMIKQAIHLFGGVMLGVGLPLSAQNQTVWDLVQGGPDSAAYSWGGHCTIVGQYDKAGNLYHYTWGEKQKATPAFSLYYDEAYALLGLDWFKADHKSPDGLAWADLKADLARVKG